MTDAEILANQPKDLTSTHCSIFIDGFYLKKVARGFMLYSPILDRWSWCNDIAKLTNIRSLDDIRELESLRKQLATANQVVKAVEDAFEATQAGVLDVNNPRESIHKLIEVNMQIALDPSVSKDAAKLVAKAKADGVKDFWASGFTLPKRTKPSTYNNGVRDTLKAALEYADKLERGE